MSEQEQRGAEMAQGAQAGETPTSTEMTVEQLAAELENLRKALRAANAESAARRKRLEELEEAEAARKNAEMSEIDRAKRAQADAEARAQAADERLRTAMIRNAVVLAAGRANFYDPEDAFRLADLDAVQIGEDGTVSGVDEALKTLAKAKPHLVRQPGTGEINATAVGRQTRTSVDALVRQKMATGEYAPI